MRIISINVNGLKAYYEKGAFDQLVNDLQPDILCMQETKVSEAGVGYWISDYNYQYIPYCNSCHFKKGYSSVATLVKEDLLQHVLGVYYPQFGKEYEQGRIVTLITDKFYLVNVYTVNSGGKDEIRQQWDIDFRNYINKLQQSKPVIIVGDLNVVAEDIDYWGIRSNVIDSGPGLMQYEIDGFHQLLNDCQLVDSFRLLHLNEQKFSWFSYRGGAREQNKGWRLDYALVSKSIQHLIIGADIYSERVGSDHCPILLEL